MNFFRALFGGKSETTEEKKKADESKNFDVLKYDGVRALKINRADYAISCFKHALEIKDDLEIHDYLSQAYTGTERFAEAYEELERLAEAQPDNEQIYIRMARIAFIMESYGVMANACEKAMLIDAGNPEVLFMYARACKGQGDTSNAEAMLTKAISIKDDYADARLLRAETLLDNLEVDAAAEDIEWLMERFTDSEEVLMLKASLEVARENNDEAVACYGKIIELNPFAAEAYKERAGLRRKAGDDKGADEDMAKFAEITPRNNSEDVERKTEEAYKQNNPYGF